MRSIAFIFTAFLICSQVNAQTTRTSAPTDAASPGYTYDYDLAKKMIIDYQVSPNNDNKAAKPITEAKDFPKLTGALTNDYHEKLRVWMEANSAIIVETLKSKKEIVHQFGN